MAAQTPTKEQQDIIDYPDGHIVVVANPGSGKTYTLTQKIVKIIEPLPHFKGVIAISFTRKASQELKSRCLKELATPKGSFFGTIDGFSLSEIIAPFGSHLFGKPKQNPVEVIESEDKLPNEFDTSRVDFRNLLAPTAQSNPTLDFVENLFCEGFVLLSSFGFLALHILRRSRACQRYIKARYTHVIVDEYQDSGLEQHSIFAELTKQGLLGIAVGDLKQSIYGFSQKSSEYLLALTQDSSFKNHPIEKNHRSHPSIVNYSNRMLKVQSPVLPADEIRVFLKEISGSTIEIGSWLDGLVPHLRAKYEIPENREFAILVRNNRGAQDIASRISIPHKVYRSTPLDNETSLWAEVFRNTLDFIFIPSQTKYETVEAHLDQLSRRDLKEILGHLNTLESRAAQEPQALANELTLFEAIARKLYPKAENKSALLALEKTVGSKEALDSFVLADSSQIQIMTLHKSKGLEFDVVFHLDLHEWILPGHKVVKENNEFEYFQDLNLHYVGVTRARKAVFLCVNSERFNSKGEKKKGVPSRFLHLDGLSRYREKLDVSDSILYD